MHVHQPQSQVCKPGESLALRKVKTPHNGKTSVSRFPLTKQDILSQYSGCFEGIGRFPGDLYRFHLKPDYKPARHAPRKVPVHLEAAFKEEIDSLVRQGILEEVKEHTDWVNSYVIVEKDTGNQHAPNHTIKKKLRICLDPRDLNEALEREPYHTRSVDEITAKLQGMRSFLGMINYLNRYSVLSAHLAAPLSLLTHQATDYKPGKTHLENFQQLKMEISNMKALPYFNISAETTLQMDASKKELGACLIQNGKVVCYASRALTKTEQNYQNLE